MQGVHTRRFGTEESLGEYSRPYHGKARAKLGRTLQGHVIAGVGAYLLKDLDERPVAKPCNVFNLKKYYF